MDTLDGLKTVVAVVETGSFTAASERLNISKALVSKYIGEIEAKLNVRLFNRTTRKISLTESGAHYYDHALSLLEKYHAMVDDVVGEQATPKGLLKVSAPVAFGELQLASLLPLFNARYPDVNIDLFLINSAVDMLEEGIDVRIKVGKVTDSTMIARHLCDVPLKLCATPQYIAEHGMPKTPADLRQHHCIVDSNFTMGRQWHFTAPNGQSESVLIHSKVAINSPQAIMNMVKANGGIGLITNHVVQNALQTGELIELLKGYQSLTFGLYLLYPHRKYVPRKVACFIEFMINKFAKA